MITTDETPTIHLNKKKFSIIEVIKEGWRQTVGLKLPVLELIGTLLLITAVNAGLSLVSLLPLIDLFAERYNPDVTHTGVGVTLAGVLFMILVLLIMFVVYFFMWFVSCMLMMIGVRKSIGLKPIINSVYKDCKASAPALFALYLIVFLMTAATYFLELSFRLVPSAYLYLTIVLGCIDFYLLWSLLTFAVPLVVARHIPALLAFSTALRAMNSHIIWVISTYIIMLIIIAISAIPLGIGLFWTLPMMFAITGIFFRDIFGLQKKRS